MSKKPNQKSQAATRIPLWSGWDAYFNSEGGASNIADVVNMMAEAVSGRYRWMRPGSNNPCNKFEAITQDSPEGVAVELIRLDPRLAAFVPPSVAQQIGDIDAAVALIRLREPDHVPDQMEEIRDAAFATVALMAHGITSTSASYTGGSDECSLDEVLMFTMDTDVDHVREKEAFDHMESALDGETTEAICSQYGIRSDFFYSNFLNDSGAGDGSGYYTNTHIVRFMPCPSMDVEEGEYYEYECELCEQPSSSCDCVWDDESGEQITRQEHEERQKARADGGDGDGEASTDTGAQVAGGQ